MMSSSFARTRYDDPILSGLGLGVPVPNINSLVEADAVDTMKNNKISLIFIF